MNRLNPSSVENVIVVFLRLHKFDWNCARLCSTLILGTSLWESYLVSWIKFLVDIMSFSYWSFISQLEVRSEIYGFSKIDHQMVLYEERNQYFKNQIEVIWAFYEPHNTPHGIKPSIIYLESLHILLSISETLENPYFIYFN